MQFSQAACLQSAKVTSQQSAQDSRSDSPNPGASPACRVLNARTDVAPYPIKGKPLRSYLDSKEPEARSNIVRNNTM